MVTTAMARPSGAEMVRASGGLPLGLPAYPVVSYPARLHRNAWCSRRAGTTEVDRTGIARIAGAPWGRRGLVGACPPDCGHAMSVDGCRLQGEVYCRAPTAEARSTAPSRRDPRSRSG